MEFIDYKTFKKIKNSVTQVNEKWASDNVMGLIAAADKNSSRAWYQSFVKDFYKKYNISIDKVKDTDFQKIDPHDFFNKKPYNVNPDKYLAVFINNDPAIKQEAKEDTENLLQTLSELETKKKTDKTITIAQIEQIKSRIDMIKKIEIPVLVAIGMGTRVVYYGFMTESDIKFTKFADELPPAKPTKGIVYKTPHQVYRYGVNAAAWTRMRYWGLSEAGELTAENTADRSTDCYILDIEELQAKYGMGDKLAMRANAKVDNPFFMSDDEIASENRKRYTLLKQQGIAPIDILNLFKTAVELYMKNYADNIKTLTPKGFNDVVNRQIKINNTSIIGMGNVFSQFDEILKNYKTIFDDYTKFLGNDPVIGKTISDKKQSKTDLTAIEAKWERQHSDLQMQLLDLKRQAEKLVKDIQTAVK